MNNQSNKQLSAQNISYSIADKEILSGVSVSLRPKERVALVGINGSGKSTLLKIMSGELTEYDGSVSIQGKVRYVPQIELDSLRTDQTVHEFLAEKSENWWDTMHLLEQVFGLTFTETSKITHLSGGEIMKLYLCSALSDKPDFLLLDEPTNHLDIKSLAQLIKVTQEFEGGIVIVSHNRYFLNKVTQKTWELENGSIKEYGGNYDFYKNHKSLEKDALLRKYEVEKKKLRKAKDALQKENIRFQRSQAKLSRMARENDRSLPKIVRNALKGKGQTKHGQSKRTLDQSVSETSDHLRDLEAKTSQRKSLYLELGYTSQKGLIIKIDGGKLTLPDGRNLLKNIAFFLYHGDRIVVTGNNGAGKTTFINEISGRESTPPLLSGSISTGSKPASFTHIDQKYGLVHPGTSLYDNLLSNNPKLTNELARRFLSNLGFHDDASIQQEASTLSGGETARLAFAIATSSKSDVIVVDEPTNNLDIDTIETITNSLKEYPGTILAISHDVSFLSDIGITKAYKIDAFNLKPMKVLPADQDAFFKEISEIN